MSAMEPPGAAGASAAARAAGARLAASPEPLDEIAGELI